MARAPGTRSTMALDTEHVSQGYKLTSVEVIFVFRLVMASVPLMVFAVLARLDHEDTCVILIVVGLALLHVAHNV